MKHANRIKNSGLQRGVICNTHKNAAGLVLLAAMLVGCGQKGALYLPGGSGSHTVNGTQNTHQHAHTQSNSQNNTQHTGAKQHAQQTTEDNADF